MTAYVEMYNALPDVEDADKRFVEREATLSKLGPLFSKYDYQFGACLVHSHSKLQPGEKMIATGYITEPVIPSANLAHFPERWLSNGEPYEFTTQPTPSPPAELVAEFQKIVGDIGVLGLYFAGSASESQGKILLEHTEGRKNIMEQVSEFPSNCIETTWNLGPEPGRAGCRSFCKKKGNTHTTEHTLQPKA